MRLTTKKKPERPSRAWRLSASTSPWVDGMGKSTFFWKSKCLGKCCVCAGLASTVSSEQLLPRAPSLKCSSSLVHHTLQTNTSLYITTIFQIPDNPCTTPTNPKQATTTSPPLMYSFCVLAALAASESSGPAVMVLFGKSGLQGPPTRVALLSGTFSCDCPSGATRVPCSRPGEDPNAWKQFGPEPSRAMEPRYRPPGQQGILGRGLRSG